MKGLASETSGILAALAAPFLMSLGFIIWDVHWKKGGGSAFSLNLFKCNLATMGFIVMSLIFGFTRSSHQNDEASSSGDNDVFTVETVGYLILSSTLGILVGDSAWLEALRQLGATRVLVVDTIKPFCAAAMGYFFLGESIHAAAYVGMALTTMGILLVSFEEQGVVTVTGDPNTEEQVSFPSIHIPNNDPTQIQLSPFPQSDNESNSMSISEHTSENRLLETTSISLLSLPSSNKEQIAILADTSLPQDEQEKLKSDHIMLDEERRTIQIQQQQHADNDERYEDEFMLSNATLPTSNIPDNTATLAQSLTSTAAVNGDSNRRRGYVMAVSNVLFDTYGSLLTKQHGSGMTSWSINLIRFGFAGFVLLIIYIGVHVWRHCGTSRNIESTSTREEQAREIKAQPMALNPWYSLPYLTKKAWLQVASGVLFVTFLCPALSNYALFEIALALAITLGSISPLYAMLLDWPIQGIRPSMRKCFGASLAVGGVIILSIFHGGSATT
eukprot:scaffold59642_cov52-Attheya_sp.AAC.1